MASYYIETIRNKRGRSAILFRKSWREGQKIRKQTLGNFTDLPPALINGFDAILRGGIACTAIEQALRITRSLPHGHIAAVLGTAQATGLARILHRTPSRQRSLALAAVVSQLIAPDSKPATARRLSPQTCDSSLGEILNLGNVSGNEMLSMLDWLLKRQKWIERSLANRHLHDATLLLHDVTSSYLEGRHCPLASFGYDRDGKKGRMQIVFGLLCAADGCPIAVEVFRGNAADPGTVSAQVSAIQQRFGIQKIALVGDRGMITTARIKADLQPAGLDWISALRNDGLRKILDIADRNDGRVKVDALKADGVVELTSEAFPGETIMVCLNARLQGERARKRARRCCRKPRRRFRPLPIRCAAAAFRVKPALRAKWALRSIAGRWRSTLRFTSPIRACGGCGWMRRLRLRRALTAFMRFEPVSGTWTRTRRWLLTRVCRVWNGRFVPPSQC